MGLGSFGNFEFLAAARAGALARARGSDGSGRRAWLQEYGKAGSGAEERRNGVSGTGHDMGKSLSDDQTVAHRKLGN